MTSPGRAGCLLEWADYRQAALGLSESDEGFQAITARVTGIRGSFRGRGRLDVVATPIGNLADGSERARQSLAEADVIAVEDARRTLALLDALGLSRPLVSLHAHNEARRAA